MRVLWVLVLCSLLNQAMAQGSADLSSLPVDSSYFSSFDSTRIYYEVRGHGKPILLVHGFIMTGRHWKSLPLYTALLQNGYKVILLDMRGNGSSDKPHDTAAYQNDAEAKDIMQLMDHLHVKQYCAVGYSRGSIITARLLVLDKRLQCAVLGGMGADFTNPEWPRRKLFYRALMGDTTTELQGIVTYVKQQPGLDVLALANMQKGQPSTSKEALANVRQPVLVISGDRDTDNGSAAELAKLLPHATLKSVPGDHSHTMATDAFSTAILHFLKLTGY
jgi:pimeloyl-ACP methyl ester carboxylesterase